MPTTATALPSATPPASAPSPQTAPGGATRRDDPFPEDEFVTIPNVPVFAEHTTSTPDGRELHFGPAELQQVADRCNRRIAETGDYAVLCLGHTPGPQAAEMGAPQPEAVGFAGPFRVGTFSEPGSERTRHAILADLHIYQDDWHKAKKHSRRSAELWVEDSYDEMFLDPIALLGSEPPRLDLGLVYSRQHEGKVVQKYSAVFPGANNVFVQDGGRDKFQAEEGSVANLAPDDIRQIVEAIDELPWVQWVKSQMDQEQESQRHEPEAAPGAEPMPQEPEQPVNNQFEPEQPQEEVPMATAETQAPSQGGDHHEGNMQNLDDDRGRKMAYAAMDELSDDEIEQYMAGRKQHGAGKKYQSDAQASSYDQTAADAPKVSGSEEHLDDVPGKETPPKQYMAEGSVDKEYEEPTRGGAGGDAQYHRTGDKLQYQLRQMQDRLTAAERQLDDERGRRVDAERYSRLSRLKFENGFTFDEDEAMKRLCYSKVRSEDEFNDLLQFLIGHSERAPINRDLPYFAGAERGNLHRPGTEGEREKYSRSQMDQAMANVKRRMKREPNADTEGWFEEELDKLASQNGVA